MLWNLPTDTERLSVSVLMVFKRRSFPALNFVDFRPKLPGLTAQWINGSSRPVFRCVIIYIGAGRVKNKPDFKVKASKSALLAMA